jgi:hypothetical protein
LTKNELPFSNKNPYKNYVVDLRIHE